MEKLLNEKYRVWERINQTKDIDLFNTHLTETKIVFSGNTNDSKTIIV